MSDKKKEKKKRSISGLFSARSSKEEKLLSILDLNPRTEKKLFNNEALRKIVTEHPNLVKKTYKFQCYEKKVHPIIMAFFLHAERDVFKFMYKTYPKVKESCPLSAIILKASLEEFKSALAKDPDDIGRIFSGLNFLHIASTFGTDIEVAKFLAEEIHPKSFRKADSTGCTPLALACKMDQNFEFIKILVDKAPLAVQELNNKGVSPLHHAVARENASLEIVKLLVEVWPEALKVRDVDGDSPLHDAVLESVPMDVINYLAEECPDMLLKKNKEGHVPYLLEKAKGKDANSEIMSYLGVASFYRKMQEEDDRSPIFKMNELVPLICDVHVMRLFYTFINTSWRMELIDDSDRKRFIKAGLDEAAKTTACTKSTATFKVILKKAQADSLITEFQGFELDREAEVTHTSHSSFIKDMWAHINANTARIDRLEIAVDNLNDNVKGLHAAVNRLRNAMVHRRKVENTMFFMNVVFSVMAMGAVGDQITQLMSQVVDFGDLEDLKVTFPEDSSVFEDASDAASESAGDVQVKDMFGTFASFETKQESLLLNDAAWGGCLFSLAFAAGITNKKVKKVLKDGVRPSDLEFDIPQVVVPKLSQRTLAQRVARIECDMGVDGDRGGILVKVKNLEKQVFGEGFDAGPSNVLSRVTALEKSLYNEDASKPQEIDIIPEEKKTPQTDAEGKENEGFHNGKTQKGNSLGKVESAIDNETKHSDAEKDIVVEPNIEAVTNDEKDMENNSLATLNDIAEIEVNDNDVDAKKKMIDSFAKMEVLLEEKKTLQTDFERKENEELIKQTQEEEKNVAKRRSSCSVEGLELATAIRESNDIEAKRNMIDSFATKESGGEIIPNNHEEDFELDDMALASLLDMGFEFGPAYIILKKCNNNHDIALTMLLNGEVT